MEDSNLVPSEVGQGQVIPRVPGLPLPQSGKLLLLLGLWLVFTLWTGWGTVSNGLTALQNSGASPDQFAAYDPSPFFFCLNAWGLSAALFVGLIVRNSFGWLNGKRLVFGCMAFAMILGRLICGGLGGLLLYTGQVNGLLMFFAMPFVTSGPYGYNLNGGLIFSPLHYF